MQKINLFLSLTEPVIWGSGALRKHKLLSNRLGPVGGWRKPGSPAVCQELCPVPAPQGQDKYSQSLKSLLWVWVILGEQRVLWQQSPLLPRLGRAGSHPGTNGTETERMLQGARSTSVTPGWLLEAPGAPKKGDLILGWRETSCLIPFSQPTSP